MILDDIVANKIQEIALSKRRVAPAGLKIRAEKQPPSIDFAKALSGPGIKLISEVKKASPSRGIIRHDFDPVTIARIYDKNGAAAISVLTDEKFFQGKIDYLRAIRKAVGIPILRKDFILEPYQVYESRANGADAILLIVSILTPATLKELLDCSHSLGMACLVEVNSDKDMEIALNSGARIIGINNRDLTTMTVDIRTTERLRPLIPVDRLVVSESGIKNCHDIERIERMGVNAVLVGETLMASLDIETAVKELLGKS
jgi:indole-3-glycerol phosphate synthase